MKYFMILFLTLSCQKQTSNHEILSSTSIIIPSKIQLMVDASAKLFCSCYYISKRDEKSCDVYAHRDLPPMLLKPKITIEPKTATIKAKALWGIYRSRVRWLGEKYGCSYL